MLHRTNDSYRATNPADEFLGPEPEEDAPEEPLIAEVWNGNGSYVTEVRYPGRTWTIATIQHGQWAGDYYVSSNDGKYLGEFETFARAMQRIRDREEN